MKLVQTCCTTERHIGNTLGHSHGFRFAFDYFGWENTGLNNIHVGEEAGHIGMFLDCEGNKIGIQQF